MKIIIILLISFFVVLTSCEMLSPEKGDPKTIKFKVIQSDTSQLEEIKIIAFSIENGLRHPYDSVYHNPKASSGIIYKSGLVLGFMADSVTSIRDGIYEIKVNRVDGTAIEKEFGKIEGTESKQDYTIKIGLTDIIVE